MKHTLIYETMIDRNVEEIFHFHSDTGNLALITPSNLEVVILKYSPPMKAGDRVTLRIKKWIISFEWELIFEEVSYPYKIVDVAIRSPFKTFRHEHEFIPVNGQRTKLRDRITFSLPLWPLSLPLVWFIKRDIRKMFAYRHRQTASLLAP